MHEDSERDSIGTATILGWARRVCAAFPGDGAGCALNEGPVFEALLDALGFQSLREHFVPRPHRDVAAFVDEAARHACRNPILVEFAARVTEHPDAEALVPRWTDVELVRAVHYAFLLDSLATAMGEEPAGDGPLLMETVHTLLQERRAGLDWRRHMNAFERMKIRTIEGPYQARLGHKRGTTPIVPPSVRPIWYGYSLNILEAMAQDTLLGNDDNARAGLELVFEPDGPVPHDEALGNAPRKEWVFEGPSGEVRTGVALTFPPLPEAWVDLYQSWNLAFVSTYENNLEFFAKLLTPAVSGRYHDVPGTYMSFRLVCLYIHAHYEMFERSRGRELDAGRNNEALTRLWGEVNRDAAAAYRERVDALGGPESQAMRRARRREMGAIWSLVRTAAGIVRRFR